MARLRDIVIDCASPATLAKFWAAAVDGYRIRPYDDPEIARLAALGHTPETDPTVAIDGPGPTFFLQRWDGGFAERSRLHLDLVANDRADEVDRLCGLGARVREVREELTILLDPEGNAFCILDAGSED